MPSRRVTPEEFAAAYDAVWTEIEYQNNLPIRTEDEAASVPAFLTLLRRYMRKVEESWADNAGTLQPDGQIQTGEALHGLRKLASICIRSMIYNGIRKR